MLLERKELTDSETNEIYVESLFDSSNIMKSIFIPGRELMYIIFKKGVVYSYNRMDNETYVGFENADSQGVYFAKNIAKNRKFVCYREYKLYEFEKKDIQNLINEHKQLLEENNNS